MSDAKFVPDVAPLSLGEIVELTGAVLAPGADAGLRIGNIAALDRAGPGDLAFLDSVKYAGQLRETRASACLTSVRFEKQAPAHVAVLRVREPYRAFITVARKLFPSMLRPTSVFATTGIAPGATIHPSARLEAEVTVDPGVVIGPQAEVGSGTLIARQCGDRAPQCESDAIARSALAHRSRIPWSGTVSSSTPVAASARTGSGS